MFVCDVSLHLLYLD